MLRRIGDDSSSGDERVAASCEMFLQGRYVDWLVGEAQPVPAWARLNRAAHGDRWTIRQHVLDFELPQVAETWTDVEVLVEAAVLAGTSDDGLVTLQREVLVPFELELMTMILSPRAAVDRVHRALT
jgi:hypothetical protein